MEADIHFRGGASKLSRFAPLNSQITFNVLFQTINSTIYNTICYEHLQAYIEKQGDKDKLLIIIFKLN